MLNENVKVRVYGDLTKNFASVKDIVDAGGGGGETPVAASVAPLVVEDITTVEDLEILATKINEILTSLKTANLMST